ncbi:sialidase family protein [Candidatus Nitrospira allomarina]|uniref:Sialidase family protein n=1 Tax=Candidatus Nitrospira allomarina TaxID=3020900 RepID=A0AA96GIY1_9BACT|nr:sialidase family protein [Candidatus Nitrospira allomarina]WNM59808.1 sialidase family protein [Candidatus Nitrospira allomarina]
MIRPVLFGTISLILSMGLGGDISGVLGADPSVSIVQAGAKHVIDHQGMQTTGPAAQLDKDGTLHLAWGGEKQEDRGVYYLKVPPPQEQYPEPIRVNPSSPPATSLHEPPALALGHKNDVYITWTTPHPNAGGKLFTNLLLLSRSLDGGKTFLPPVRVNDDDAVTGHSFDHLTVSPNGSVHISWLDAREGKKDPATYTVFSQDQGRTLSPNLKIDESSCVCCRTHMTTASDGNVYLAWRKVLAGAVRETVVSRSTDNGKSFSPPVIVGNDQWVYEGCPHRPATMGVDQQGRLYVTWYTEGPDDTPGVYLAYSDDQGKTFTPRRVLNMSKGTFPDHPQLAVNREGHLLVSWEEQSPVRREIVFTYSLDRGQTFSPPKKLNEKKAKSPAVALNDQGQAVIAWSEQVVFPGWSTVIQPLSFPTPRTAQLHPKP